MSDAQHDHESLIRTPKQLVIAVAGFFLVVVLGIILLVTFVTNASTTGAGSNAQSAEAIAARIRPVSDAGFTLRDANTPRVLLAGGAVYTATCAACHDSGMAGSPKTGDKAAWATRLAQGYDTLVTHAINGIRAMPAKGGNPDLDDLEVARAVVFMTNQSGASFKEPVAPAPAAAPAAATTAAAAPVAGDAASAMAAAPVAAVPAAMAAAAPAAAAAPVAGPAVASADTGKKAYDTACFACHGAGIAGAPKFGDKAAWSARIGQGSSVLYDHAIKGFQGKAGVMPPKGGSALPDADVKAAVDYMVAAVK
jgi:cytochrome c5